MRRRLFTLSSLLSLLVCVAVGVLWARSNPIGERIQANYKRWPGPDEVYAYYFAAASYSGTLSLRFNRQHFAPGYLRGLPAEAARLMREQYHPPGLRWQYIGRPTTKFPDADPPRPGFRATYYTSKLNAAHRSDDWVLAVPSWLPAVLLLVMPALWLNRFRLARRAIRQGLCPACGYDLRAHTPGDRCPECGTVARAESGNRPLVPLDPR